MSILLNGLQVIEARIFIPWRGVWRADLDIDPGLLDIVPTGKVTMLVGESTIMIGTVDSRGSGKFGEKATIRVLGGGGGWQNPVTALGFHNDAGVLSTAVITATAAEVGEVAIDAAPTRLGLDYFRSAGAASRVLAGRDWFVDLTGTTTVGPRPPAALSQEVDILEWDPLTKTATLAADDIILPGTLLKDDRFETTTVRDVEMVFNAEGMRATAWCNESGVTALADALKVAVIEFGGIPFLRRYRYRVVLIGPDGRLTLQSVEKAAGVPDALMVTVSPGMAGLSAKPALGSECHVAFINGNASQPFVVGFDGQTPTELSLGDKTLAQPVAMAPLLRTELDAIWQALATHTHPTAAVGAPSVPTPPIVPQPSPFATIITKAS